MNLQWIKNYNFCDFSYICPFQPSTKIKQSDCCVNLSYKIMLAI